MNALGYTLSVLCLPVTALALGVRWVRRGMGEAVSERVHVMPVNDLIEHETDVDCVCDPDQDVEQPRLYIHHSLDGREANE